MDRRQTIHAMVLVLLQVNLSAHGWLLSLFDWFL
jgi:hypothetical protein